jgi:hypothetical protein
LGLDLSVVLEVCGGVEPSSHQPYTPLDGLIREGLPGRPSTQPTSPSGWLRWRRYPGGMLETVEAAAAGALCMAALTLLAVGISVYPRQARGGAVLGMLPVGAVHGLAYALCKVTPYCLGE